MNIFTQAKIQQVRSNTARRAVKARAIMRSNGLSVANSNILTRDLIGRIIESAAIATQIPQRYF